MNALVAAESLFIINKGSFLLLHILQPPDHIQDAIKTHKSTLDKHVLWDGSSLPWGMTKLNSVEGKHYSHIHSEWWGSEFSYLFLWKLHMELLIRGHLESHYQKQNSELILIPFPLMLIF